MNTIEGVLDHSDYKGYWDYINFKIDNVWLDEKLDELYPNKMYRGLIPTLVEWLNFQNEKEVVWKRILPKTNVTSVCPILMCPDDCDFSCTIIVAEITNFGRFIKWNRLGVDITKEFVAEKVGSEVEWFDKIKEMNFELSDYIKMLNKFKERLEVDKNTI